MSDLKFFKCPICGNIVELVINGGGELVCCGKPMQHLEANVTDASMEKHVPDTEIKDDQIIINIGSAPHPMTEEHHIQWVAVSSAGKMVRAGLKPGDAPTVIVSGDGFSPGETIIYEYCNLHGLWKSVL